MAGDLNLKKSWNPALVKNQKKVWQEEQNKLDELKRIRELNKEHDREQEYLQMLKLQHGSDFKTKDLSAAEKLRLNKLDWMYKDVPDSKLTKNDAGFIERSDELPDKSKVENMLAGNQAIRAARNMSVMDKVVHASSQSVPKASQRLDDDPLLKIQREQRLLKFSRSQPPSDHTEKSLKTRDHTSRNLRSSRHAEPHRHRHEDLSQRSHSSRHRDQGERRLSRHRVRDDRDRSPSSRHRTDEREEKLKERSRQTGPSAVNENTNERDPFTPNVRPEDVTFSKRGTTTKSFGLMY